MNYEKLWCVTDFEDKFIIVRTVTMINNSIGCEENHIIPMVDFESSKAAWDAFNEWQYTKCPYPVSE